MWLDPIAFSQWLKLRDKFGVRELIETGTYHGTGAAFYAHYFERVDSCEKNAEAYALARNRTAHIKNLYLYNQSSPAFLFDYKTWYMTCNRQDTVLFFLDAHWANDWPILEELKALKDLPNCVVIIHDFKVEGLGYISRDGQPLDLDFVRRDLKTINPGFSLYTNSREWTALYTRDEILKHPAAIVDTYTEDGVLFAWSAERRKYRGMLYAVPEKLDSSFLLKEVA